MTTTDPAPSTTTPTLVHTIIYAKYVVPVIPHNVVYTDYAILINEEGTIVALVSQDEAATHYRASTPLVDLTHHIVLPGLINAHTHASMNLLKGLADDKNLHEWLTQDIWPVESAFVSPAFVSDGTTLAIAEMLRSGTTCYNDMYFYPSASAQVVDKCQIRAVLGHIVLEFPTCVAESASEYLDQALAVHHAPMSNSSLITSAIAPHAPYTVSDATLVRVNDMSKTMNWPIHMHVHETEAECRDSAAQHPTMSRHLSEEACHPIQNLHRLGILSSRLIAVHMTQLTTDEIQLVAQSHTNVVHCPTSNLKLGSGTCPVSDLLDAEVNVALGTDSASSNNTLDMFAEMKLAALLSPSITAATALKMATWNGAKALGLEHKVGSVQVGKIADLIAVSLDSVEMMPMYNAISHLVYVATGNQVSDVWIQGQRVMDTRQLCTIDLASVKHKCQSWQDRIRAFRQHDRV